MELSPCFAVAVMAALVSYGSLTLCFPNPTEEIICEYRNMTKFLQQLAANYSHIAKLESIGLTDEDRELWTIIISDNPYHRPILRPQVKFVGNVNGMSGPACYVLLRLAKNLLEEYENEASMERKLMETMEIHILPNLNPDGYAKAVPGSCFGREGRLNANGINLNTNFPDLFVEQENLTLQKETEAVMKWLERNKFIVSVSVISGANVVVYPFDSMPLELIVGAPIGGQQHLPPDHDILQHLSLTYAEKTGRKASEWYCPGLDTTFQNGIINGAEWRPQSGTMMDYNYIHGTLEIMAGISCCRNENNVTELDKIWWKNRESLLHVIHEVQGGIRGQVLDSETYDIIEGAKLSRGNDDLYENEGLPHIPWFSTENGEFWRPWRPGVYSLKVEKDGYLTKEIEVIVEQRQATFLRVELEKIIPTTTTTTTTTTTVRSTLPTTPKYGGNNKMNMPNNSDDFTRLGKNNMDASSENNSDAKVATDAPPEEPNTNSKYYSSQTHLEHSFINLLKSVQLKSSCVILKGTYAVVSVLVSFLLLVPAILLPVL